MNIGIIVALPEEARSLLRNRSIALNRPIRLDDGYALISGMGDSAAAAAAAVLLDGGASALVSWGSAGALLPSLTPGTLLLAHQVCDEDQHAFEVDKGWRDALAGKLAADLTLADGKLVQVRNVLRNARDKRAVHEATGASAADMESVAIAGVARQAGLPFLAIRTIADTMEMSIPDSLIDSLDRYGRPRYRQLLLDLARHPRKLSDLLKLQRGFKQAQTTLSRVRQLAGQGLAYPT